VLLVVAAVLLVATGWLGHAWYDRRHERESVRRIRLGGFRLISPLLDVELPQGINVRQEPIPFRRELKTLVDEQLASGAVRDMAVYYRDLADGPWIGINEDVPYDAASLMKVPVMVAWLKRAERAPELLRRTFAFDEKSYPGGPQATPPAKTLRAGATYTVEELLQFMLRYSDNRAMWLLYNGLDAADLADVLDGMDVSNEPDDGGNRVTAHGYSGFFRVLFNASYLNKEMSEKALELLCHEDFPRGMVAGVPAGVVVASKFGELVRVGDVQLHEFGIVYHRKGPYILGVMTHGRDLARQAEVIRKVSALVYAELEGSGPVEQAR
jgi:beta-lactamase class A